MLHIENKTKTPAHSNNSINLITLGLGVGWIFEIWNNQVAAFLPGKLRDEGQLDPDADRQKTTKIQENQESKKQDTRN